MNEILKKIHPQLKKQKIILFLGAGVNYSTKNKGENFPLSKKLCKWIARDLLNDADLENEDLDEVSEIARFKVGDKKFNEYILKKFKKFKPSGIHKKIVKLPWKKIYTTNFDSLLEGAIKKERVKISPIFNSKNSACSDGNTPYYKLHGCVNKEHDLVITKEDYQDYVKHRKKIFTLLKKDILKNTFIFIGYSLKDINFRSILTECREKSLNNKLPLSYAIQICNNKTQKEFWKKKYNIQIINESADIFINKLYDLYN